VVVWVVIETTIVDAVGGGVGLVDKRREMVGSRTPNNLGRCSSNVIENKAANALHTSPTAAACDSIIEPSCISGAIFATNSIKPGMRSRTHCLSIGLPEEDANINVFAQ